jgi:hypothetical protein
LFLYSWIINPLFAYGGYYGQINRPFFQWFPLDLFKTNALIGGGPCELVGKR